MIDPRKSPLAAVVQAELLFNSKRVAPYVLLILFSTNAWLWWARGPASYRGWATDSDHFIIRLFSIFSFMTMPIFIAVLMGDPVVRDFRIGIDPLILSKPISRLQYLLGKFLGNFFVLTLCLAGFAVTMVCLQFFYTENMIGNSVRVLPIFKHFFFFVVISSLTLAMLCFTIGTLTRSVKLVYAMMTSFYLLFIGWQLTMKSFPMRWRILLDPLLVNVMEPYRGQSAEWLNQLSFSYSLEMIANRLLMLVVSIICFTIVYRRFAYAESVKQHGTALFTTMDLINAGNEHNINSREIETRSSATISPLFSDALPKVEIAISGVRAFIYQLQAAIATEIRLLIAERSLIVLMPLATLLSVSGITYFTVRTTSNYAANYVFQINDALLLFIVAIAIFYTGEALHRDRELKIEPLLWSMPIPNSVLLLSKFLTLLLLSTTLSMLVAIASIMVQIYKQHTPIEISTYVKFYLVILLPGMAFLIAMVMMMNVLLKDKYLAYVICLAIGCGLFYLYNQGYNHWLLNPVYYQLWTPSDFSSYGLRWREILMQRSYTVLLTILALLITHWRFERRA